MAGRGKKNKTGADETGNRQGPGHPPGRPPTAEEEKIRKERKNQKDREDRAKKAFQRIEFKAFCEMPGIRVMFDAFSEEYRKRNEEYSSSKDTAEEEQELKMIDERMMMKDTPKEEQELKKKLKMIDERMMREFISRWQELFKKFFEEEGITVKFKAVCLKYKEEEERNYREEFEDLSEMMENPSVALQNLEMILTGGLEGVTAVNSRSLQNLQMIQTGGLDGVSTAVDSSSFGAMGTPFGGILAEARQNSHQPASERATQGALYTTILCSHDKEASTSSRAPLQEVSVYDLLKELYHRIGDDERRERTAIAATIDANSKVPIHQSDNPPVVVPRSFFTDFNRMVNTVSPSGDAANIAATSPQFQAANARANSVE